MTRGARFQLTAANLAVQLAALRQADLGVSVPVSTTQEPKGRVGSWHFRAWTPPLGNVGQCFTAGRGPRRKSTMESGL